MKRDNAGYLIDTSHFYRSLVSLSEFDDIPKEKFRRYEIAVIQNMREGVWKPQDITLKPTTQSAITTERKDSQSKPTR